MTQSNADELEGQQIGESQWYLYASQLDSFGLRLLAQANIAKTQDQYADIKTLAFTLMCRTLLNFKGVIALAKLGLVVEARTLTRSCYENLIWVSGLVEKGDVFIQEIKNDDLRSRRSRAEFILDRGIASGENTERNINFLSKFVEDLKQISPKPKSINPKSALNNSTLEDMYLAYSQLSGDAAHPSITSLRRHIVAMREEGIERDELCIEPPPNSIETTVTLNMACSAVLGVCTGVRQALQLPEFKNELDKLYVDYEKLVSKK